MGKTYVCIPFTPEEIAFLKNNKKTMRRQIRNGLGLPTGKEEKAVWNWKNKKRLAKKTK